MDLKWLYTDLLGGKKVLLASLLGLNSFYVVLAGSTGFYWVLLGSQRISGLEMGNHGFFMTFSRVLTGSSAIRSS